MEEMFVTMIRRHPADNLTRLVYADWLDERDEPDGHARAEFLRTQHALLDSPEHAAALRLRLHELAAGLEPGWRRDVYCGSVERFGPPPVCHPRWSELITTDDPSARVCATCGERVAYCGSVTDARIAAGYCGGAVVVDPAARRSPDDLLPAPELIIPDDAAPEGIAPTG